MYFQGYSGGGHLSEDTYPGDQHYIQRRGDAASTDLILHPEESCDDIYASELSIFAEQCLPLATKANQPRTLGSEQK
eukprot:6477636-Amphidinium_carterae.1